jgi:hypothetical protein
MRRGNTVKNRRKHPDSAFSEPVDESLSGVESFDEDDMYGSDHEMEVVREESDEDENVKLLQQPEDREVSV